MTNKKELQEEEAHIIASARLRSDTNGSGEEKVSPRTVSSRRILGNLGAWRYGKYVSRAHQKRSGIYLE